MQRGWFTAGEFSLNHSRYNAMSLPASNPPWTNTKAWLTGSKWRRLFGRTIDLREYALNCGAHFPLQSRVQLID